MGHKAFCGCCILIIYVDYFPCYLGCNIRATLAYSDSFPKTSGGDAYSQTMAGTYMIAFAVLYLPFQQSYDMTNKMDA